MGVSINHRKLQVGELETDMRSRPYVFAHYNRFLGGRPTRLYKIHVISLLPGSPVCVLSLAGVNSGGRKDSL